MGVAPATLLFAAIVSAASLRLGREPVLLRDCETVEVSVRVDEPPGVDVVPLRLAVNVGSFEALTRLSAGQYRALYRCPTTRFPQVALVAVWRETGFDAPVDYLRIPLYGSTRVPVKTVPGAQVTLGVGGLSFGPQVVDPTGNVELPIDVPPGEDRALLSVRYPDGKAETRPMRISVPPYNRLTAALVPQTIVADGVQAARLEVFYDGPEAIPAARVQIETTSGKPALTGVAGGRFTYRYVPPVPAEVTDIRFQVGIAEMPVAHAATSLNLRQPSAGKAIQIWASPSHLKPGISEADLRFEIEPPVTGLRITATGGSVEGLRQLRPGLYGATFRASASSESEVAIVGAVASGKPGVAHGFCAIPIERIAVGARSPLSPTRPVFLHALTDHAATRAGESADVVVWTYAVGVDGVPTRAIGELRGEAEVGQLSPPRLVGPGEVAMNWSLPSRSPGRAQVRVFSNVDPQAAFELPLSIAGPPSRFELSASPERLVAAENGTLEVVARVFDAAGNPAIASLRAEFELSAPTPMEERGPGLYSASMAVAPSFEGRTSARLAVFREDGLREPVATQTLPLEPGEAVALEMLAPVEVIRADGVAQARFRVRTRDRFGNPALRPAPRLAKGFRTADLVPLATGEHEVRLVPAMQRQSRPLRVEVEAGPLRAEATTWLRPALSYFSVQPTAGLFGSVSGVLGFQAGVDGFFWPRAGRGFGIGLNGSWLTLQQPGGPRAAAVVADTSLAAAALLGSWRFEPTDQLLGWVSAGPGLALISHSASWRSLPALEEQAVVPAAETSLGIGYRLAWGLPVIELKASWHGDPRLLSVRDPLLGLALLAGWRHEL